MNNRDVFFLGILTGILIASVLIGTVNVISKNAPPAPWTVEERKCSRVMIKEIRAHFDPSEPIVIESILADCRYYINKFNKET